MNAETLYYIKTERTFTLLRKYSWIFTLTIAIGGLWFPKLGLLVLPVIAGLSLTSFLKGRYWCGNICPHGSLFDSLLFSISKNQKIPNIFKSKFLKIAFFVFFFFQVGRKLINVINIYGQAPFLDKLGFIFVASYLMVTVLGSLTTIFISPRTWCQFCPMGSIQHLSYKAGKSMGVNNETDAKVSIESTELCHECGMCSRVCPMQLEPYLEWNQDGQLDNEKCIRCNTCVENCPAGILEIKNKSENEFNIFEEAELDYYKKDNILAEIESVKRLSVNIKEFSFRLLEPPQIDVEAGQFILVKVSDKHQMYRAYSISGIEDDRSLLKVTVMRITDGYGSSIIFSDFKTGQQIELKGPMGHELIVDKDAKDVMLVGGGIGITPFIPIVEDIVHNDNHIENVKLIYGVNEKDQFLYKDYFEEMEVESDKFEFIPVVAFDENWSGEKGFVTDIMDKYDLKDYKIYMCGPGPMEAAARRLLNEKDFDQSHLYAEST